MIFRLPELPRLPDPRDLLPPLPWERRELPAAEEPTSQPASHSGTSQLTAAGKACIPCSSDHLSLASGALSEAVRFGRSGGIEHPEVEDRVALVFDELNAMERIDASPEKVAALPPEEKQLMREASMASRNLRHKLTDMRNLDDLEEAAAEARKAAREFRGKLFRMQLGRVDPELNERIERRAAQLVKRE